MSVFRGWMDASKSYEAVYDWDNNMPQKMDLNHVVYFWAESRGFLLTRCRQGVGFVIENILVG